MPIKPENRARYPKDWKRIADAIRERAAQQCEGSPAYPDCRAPNGEAHPVTGYEAPRWVAVSERMPAAGCKVLVFYRNNYGRARRTCAHHSPMHTVDAAAWDEGEPDETEDGTFEPEGWWEEPVEMERINFIADEVTHWMPLPEPPPMPVVGPNVADKRREASA